MSFTGDDDDADEWSAFGVPAVTSNGNALVAPASSLLSGRGEDEDWGGFMAPATSLPSVALPEPPMRMSQPPDIDQPKAFAPDKGICTTQVNADDWDAFGNSPDDITFEVLPLVVEDSIERIQAAEQQAQLQEEAFVQAQPEEKTRQE